MSYLIKLLIVMMIQNNPIEAHKWEKRVLIVSASSHTNVGYKRQNQILEKDKKGTKERDLIIYRLYDDHWLDPKNESLSKKQSDAIYREYNIQRGTFSVLLIGKDGGIKMHKEDIISTKEIFKLIDSMPMRQQEMRKQKEKDY